MQDSYREIFLSESQEYIDNINGCLVKLEENPRDLNSLNEIFRCTHTLKGMSATMGYDKIAQISHQMEDLLDELRGQKKFVTSHIIDTLFAGVDLLEKLLQEVRLNQESKTDISACMEALKNLLREEIPPEPSAAAGIEAGKTPFSALDEVEFAETELVKFKKAKENGFNVFKIQITLSENCPMKEARAFLVITNLKRRGEILAALPSLDALKEGKFDRSFLIVLAVKEKSETIRQELMGVSEVDNVTISPAQIKPQASSIPEPAHPQETASLPSAVIIPPGGAGSAGAQTEQPSSYLKKIQSIRIPVQRLDKIMNFMGELAISKIRLVQIVQSLKIQELEEISFTLDHLTSALQDEIMQTRLLPVAYILDNFTRVVRDLARRKNKEIDLEIIGSEIELDRVVLDEIGDPLIHLLRNSIDHGLETPEERRSKGKNPKGKISIQVTRQKGHISIEVADDGRGVDFAAVGRKAVEKGLIPEQEASNLDAKRVLEILTMPGFSTAKEITDTSGRGVGLDVVKVKIESLGGRLDFETKIDLGTKFLLTLPLTLAIIKAMLVKVRQEILAVPLMNIRETIKVRPEEIKMVQHFEVINVRDEVIPIIRMEKELGISANVEQDTAGLKEAVSLVIIEYEKKALALLVNQIIGEQDIVVKPLPGFVKKTKGIAGATILGNGRVALILDIMSLKN